MEAKIMILNKKKDFDKIPSIFKNVDFSSEVSVEINDINKVKVKEGDFVIIEVLETENKRAYIESINGDISVAIEGDILPVVLGYRKATLEFAGVVTDNLSYGDILYLLGSAGVAGKVTGIFPEWGNPMPMKVLGIITNNDGKILNLFDF
ncbi:MAG: hypothetical protein WBA93_31395, partial [Microcoleaceae cyanobacterium]